MSRGDCGARNDLRGVTALVTGSTRGLGREIVTALLRRGVGKVYAAGRSPGAVGSTGASFRSSWTSRIPRRCRTPRAMGTM